MKARRQPAAAAPTSSSGSATTSQEVTPSSAAAATTTHDDDEDMNSGFGDWLRSPDGIAYMRLFVVANSLVMFLTISWPQISYVLEMIGEYFADWQ